MRIRISCSVKTHAFHLAEQLERTNSLDRLYTIYHSRRDTLTARFNRRIDREEIELNHLSTFPWLAPLKRLVKGTYFNNELFDSCVCRALQKDQLYDAFIGWSGMSLLSIRQAKKDGKMAIVERGSSHIVFQTALLTEEYELWGFRFRQDQRLIDQELEEYQLADRIVVPSGFVEETFVQQGVPLRKLFRNNFGSDRLFRSTQPKRERFTILYVGNLSIRKGLPYFFEALKQLPIDPALYEVWFIGTITNEISKLIPLYKQTNWTFHGHVNHPQLVDLISSCSVAVHPSLEEGLSMVIPQLMACGVPVIATTNTGGMDIIRDAESGFIVPIRSAEAIIAKLVYLFTNPDYLTSMRKEAMEHALHTGTWDNYGDRYASFLSSLQQKNFHLQ